MAKIFLPNSVITSKGLLRKLRRYYGFTNQNIKDFLHWNNKDSEFTGTIINTDKTKIFNCSYYKGTLEQFLKDYPEGKIWSNTEIVK